MERSTEGNRTVKYNNKKEINNLIKYIDNNTKEIKIKTWEITNTNVLINYTIEKSHYSYDYEQNLNNLEKTLEKIFPEYEFTFLGNNCTVIFAGTITAAKIVAGSITTARIGNNQIFHHTDKRYKFIDFIKQQLKSKNLITRENYSTITKDKNLEVIFYNDSAYYLGKKILIDLNKEIQKIFPNLKFNIRIETGNIL